jgi:predicted alpha-1,2-mannosidase
LPHAIDRLIELKGGKVAFEQSLDTLFNTELKMQGEQHVDISGFFGKYAHGDEPGHNIPYLYNYTKSPWKTQALIRKICREFYANDPVSMPNNEDCGQMSAWYIFSSLGFYPMCPGMPEYTIGAPQFSKATITLENGKRFVVNAKNLSDKNMYVSKVSLNGKPISSWTLLHKDIIKGGELTFEMADKP